MPPDEVLEPFALSAVAHVFAFWLGALFGSFANVCIYRWPADLSVVRPGSRCSSCSTPIAWYDNIPLLSYLLLRGRCRHCQTEFSARYLFVEAATALLFLAAYHHTVVVAFPFEPLSLRAMRFLILAAFLFTLVVITFIDLDYGWILDKITLPGIAIFYGLGQFLPERSWPDGLIGAAVGYGVPWLIGTLYALIRGREGLGLGDAKFLAMVGALFGWQGVVAALFIGSLLGTIVSIPLLYFTNMRDWRPADSDPGDMDEAQQTGEASPESGDANESTSAQAGAEPSPAASDDPDSGDREPTSLGQMQIPFGPFLAVGAAVYAFAEPWLHIQLLGM